MGLQIQEIPHLILASTDTHRHVAHTHADMMHKHTHKFEKFNRESNAIVKEHSQLSKKKTYFIEIEKTRANYSLIKDGAQEFTKRN